MENIDLSPIERSFWDSAGGRIAGLEAQQSVGPYRVDFLVREKRLVIELDGYEWHHTKEQRNQDLHRQRRLLLMGYQVIRFSGSDINRDCYSCVSDVLRYMESLPDYREQDADSSSEMPYCTRMQEVVTHLLDRFSLNIHGEGYVVLSQGENFDPLYVSRSGNIVSVSHYFVQNGDMVPDPSIEFYTIAEGGYEEWVPLEMTQILGRSEGAEVDENDQIQVVDSTIQHDIAYIADIWSRNIRLQGWVENATVKDNSWENEPVAD